MKIAKSIRNAYNSVTDEYKRLSEEICSRLEPEVKLNEWFFRHRLKELESFALKIETGRVDDPRRMEDFFASTIVVPNMSAVSDAEQLLEGIYEVYTRRPSHDETTLKKASDFVFDDLRIYLKFKTTSTGRNEDLEGLIFEVQIKTILQYAWEIASHDLTYKTDDVSWPKERIAFQVKAMLEHAEIAIAEADRLANSPAISKKDPETTSTLEIINVIREFWNREHLPNDLKRLARSILRVMNTCELKSDKLEAVLVKEKQRIGILPTNLSPYAFLIQALAHNTDLDFKTKITSNLNERTRILIHDDMELPDWMKEPNDKIICV